MARRLVRVERWRDWGYRQRHGILPCDDSMIYGNTEMLAENIFNYRHLTRIFYGFIVQSSEISAKAYRMS